MKTTLTRWLACLAILTATTTVSAEGWMRELDDVKDVTLGDLLRAPKDYMDIPVRMHVYFNKEGKTQNPYYTRFNEDWYGNFSAWPIDARLYEKRDFQRVYGLFFVQKGAKVWKELLDEDRMQSMEILCVVRDVFRGSPWIEVFEYDTHSKGLDEEAVREILKGEGHFHNGRHKQAARMYDSALSSRYPRHVRVDLMRRLGDAYYHQGKYSSAIDTYEDALELAPKNAVLNQSLAASREAKKHQNLKSRKKSVPQRTVQLARRAMDVLDPKNDIDEIIKRFEDPKKVADEVNAHKTAVLRNSKTEAKLSPMPVAGESKPEAVTADGSEQSSDDAEVVEEPAVDDTDAVEPATEVSETPAVEAPAAETPTEAVVVEEDAVETEVVEDTVEESVEETVVEGNDGSGDATEETTDETVEEQDESAEGCTSDETSACGDSDDVVDEAVEETAGDNAEETVDEGTDGCAEAIEETTDETTDETAEEQGESAEGCTSDESSACSDSEDAVEEAADETVATENACGSDETADDATDTETSTENVDEALEELATGTPTEDNPSVETDAAGTDAEGTAVEDAVADSADAPVDAPATDPVVVPGFTDVPSDGAADAMDPEVAEVTVSETDSITDDDILDAGKNVVMVSGKLMKLPRLPFFACEAVTVQDLLAILEEIHSTTIE